MNSDLFFEMAESLKLYRRAEIKPRASSSTKPIDDLYVDPLNGNATLKTVLSDNTVFLLGRKGTGKSTIFSKAESELSKSNDVISVYIDVKSLYDVISVNGYSDTASIDKEVSVDVYRMHQARREILDQILSALITSFRDKLDKISLLDRLTGKKKTLLQSIEKLDLIKSELGDSSLEQTVLPTLRKITRKITSNQQAEKSETGSINGNLAVKGSIDLSNKGTSCSAEITSGLSSSLTEFNKVLSGNDIYDEYSDIFVKSFPFQRIIKNIQETLDALNMSKLYVFLDDFSEIELLDQKLFVDVILATLNNSSNEYIKLKIAAYPGRVYFGRLDPSKCTILHLDFYDLYESNETQEMEKKACVYTRNLINKRFEYYAMDINDYFELSSNNIIDDYYYHLFKASFNVPRIIGNIFHILFKDRISQGNKINHSSIELASRKYYESVIVTYFDMMSRFAQEPFDNKLDRYNQKELMTFIVDQAKENKTNIKKGLVGGKFFDGLKVIYSSHFSVKEELSSVLSSLEANFLISRYKKMRNKESETVYVYALFYGLCIYEKIDWGYPESRSYRAYFQQRCFDYSSRVHQFLSSKSCYKCNLATCNNVMADDEKNTSILEMFGFLCPQCRKGIMIKQKIIPDGLKKLITHLDSSMLLEPIELSILSVLHGSDISLSASEIAGALDTNRQLIGKRTGKLQDQGLVDKEKDSGKTMNKLTKKAIELYFNN
ncbi:helix-turn-helix transcriptional regulator [Salmonella enterica]|nr:helix-turn-helix transcriptional regulator [Salmonella enterica]